MYYVSCLVVLESQASRAGMLCNGGEEHRLGIICLVQKRAKIEGLDIWSCKHRVLRALQPLLWVPSLAKLLQSSEHLPR